MKIPEQLKGTIRSMISQKNQGDLNVHRIEDIGHTI